MKKNTLKTIDMNITETLRSFTNSYHYYISYHPPERLSVAGFSVLTSKYISLYFH